MGRSPRTRLANAPTLAVRNEADQASRAAVASPSRTSSGRVAVKAGAVVVPGKWVVSSSAEASGRAE